MKVVIVGGVAGGATAAARLRRLDEKAEIVIFERSGYVSYANCGLPYYIGGVIEDQRELTLQSPQSFWRRFRVAVKVRHEVRAVNRTRKTVTVCALDTGEVFEESYDKLILSPGALPVRPELPGIGSSRILTLRTVEDTLRIRQEAEREELADWTVIGGGFIGLEAAENLRERGRRVRIIQQDPHVLAPLDGDMASFLHAHLRAKGVELLLGRNVTGFEERGEGLTVRTDGGDLATDRVLLAVGVRPDSALAREAGLKLDVRGSIWTDDRMRTSDPDIYAVGDAVSVPHAVTGQRAVIALAGPANKQGHVAADQIAGLDSRYRGSPASSVLKVFDMTAAFTGLNEEAARAAGLDFDKVILAPASHASYYPGGRVMTLKLLFERPTLRILGAQIVGFEGVDKRLDVIAAAMQAGLKASDLADLDLAYAPPYSSAKDPVNMAGYLVRNLTEGLVRQFCFEDLPSLPPEAVLLDVRTPGEYARGHAEGFETHIPVDDLRERLGELDPARPVYVMCQSGLRSYIACRILAQHGFTCYNFAGGYRLYESLTRDRFDARSRTDCGLR